MRAAAAKLLPNDSVRLCAKHAGVGATVAGGKAVMIRSTKYGGRTGNVMTCGSVWHCPVCAAKLATQRQKHLAKAIVLHRERGGNVVMLTLTQGHKGFEKISECAESMIKRFGRVVSGKAWDNMKANNHLLGFVRAVEVTHGNRGWHPHLHVLFFLEPQAGSAELVYFLPWLVERWCRFTEKDGFKVNENAQHYRMADCADTASSYVTKWGVDWEMTHAHIKHGKGGRTPFQILADYVGARRDADAYLFQEYAKAFKGKRQLQWSPILKAAYPEAFRPDADLLEEQDEGQDIAAITEDTYIAMREADCVEEALEAAHVGGLIPFLSVLSNNGISNAGVFPPEKAEQRWKRSSVLRDALRRRRYEQCSR